MSAGSLAAYARALAIPVARGLLPLCRAQAGLRATAYGQARAGTLDGDGDPEGAFAFANLVLDQHLRTECGRISETLGRIGRAIKPMVELRLAVSAILAKAHEINGADGYPLTDDEIEDYVTERLWWAMQPKRGAR